MKLRPLSALVLTSTVLSSCIYYTQPVPEMPYNAQPAQPAPADAAAYAAAAQYEGVWSTTAAPTAPTAAAYYGGDYAGVSYQPNVATLPVAPQPVATTPTTPAVIPPPVASTASSSAITQPQVAPQPVAITPAPAVTPATVKPTTPTTTSTTDPKSITNTGPIPVATPVPGDPTRVYNPLDSSKTIRITDKNGKIYPSGKELKVRGTNFHFYVP